MIVNHKEAQELAIYHETDSNLARAYLDLAELLVCITHHDGAIDEFKPRWLPIVEILLRDNRLVDIGNTKTL